MESDENIFHAAPQVRGRIAHASTDNNTYSSRSADITSLSVFSDELGIMGKIDLYRSDRRQLIERKYSLKHIYRGQMYQLWAEYFCMIEAGYEIDSIAFYETSTNKLICVDVPGECEKAELMRFIQRFRNFSPELPITINRNKCAHCVYCNLCDKAEDDNVYT